MVRFFPHIPKTPSSVARAVEQKQTVNVILKMSKKCSVVKKEIRFLCGRVCGSVGFTRRRLEGGAH